MGWTGGPQEVDCNVIGGTAAGTAVPGAVRTHGGKLVGGDLVEVLEGSSRGQASSRGILVACDSGCEVDSHGPVSWRSRPRSASSCSPSAATPRRTSSRGPTDTAGPGRPATSRGTRTISATPRFPGASSATSAPSVWRTATPGPSRLRPSAPTPVIPGNDGSVPGHPSGCWSGRPSSLLRELHLGAELEHPAPSVAAVPSPRRRAGSPARRIVFVRAADCFSKAAP